MNTTALKPSGDATGVADFTAVTSALATDRSAWLGPGTWIFSESVVLGGDGQSVYGWDDSTVVKPRLNSVPVFVLRNSERSLVSSLRIVGGLHGVLCDRSHRTCIQDVSIHATRSHGIACVGGTLILSIRDCRLSSCGGNGVEASETTPGNGNALSIHGTSVEWCEGHGLHWSGTGLGVFGCCIEGNKQSGIWLDGANVVTGGAAINGCYLEGNRRSQIRMNGVVSKGVHSVQVSGNYFLSHGDEPGILCGGERGEVRRIVVDPSNFFGSEEGSLFIDAGDACRHSRLHIKAMSRLRCLNPTDNTITHDGMEN